MAIFSDMASLSSAQPERLVLLGLAVIGFQAIARTGLAFLLWVWVTFLRPGKRLSRYGPWALVTGCTDGIGRSFCFQLARRGLNLVLVSRSESKLLLLATELKSKHKIDVKIVAVDFTDPDLDSGIARIREAIDGIDVGILVNNAGMSYPYARFFHEVDDNLAHNILRMNVETITRMVQVVIPGMVKRKKGAIVNIGSGAASVLPSDPLYSLYAGTKAFIDQLSRSLYVEYKRSGIDVQCQVPLYVATKLASIRKASFWAPSPDTYARCAMRWIGYEPRCTPYWPHSVLWWIASSIPDTILDSFRMKFCLDIRRRGQKKDAMKKE